MPDPLPLTGIDSLDEIHSLRKVDEFLVVERIFSQDVQKPSIGLANIHPAVNDIEGNREKVLRAARIFKERKTNIAMFPEFCLTGYFWDDHEACRAYMDKGVLEEQFEWVEESLMPLLDDHFREIVLNGLTRAAGGKYYNTTILVDRDFNYRKGYNYYHKMFLPGLENDFTEPGTSNRMVADGEFGRFGFTTCYDFLFSELLREYAFEDHVDAILQTACWRALATRDYPSMNVRTDQYYGKLWDMVAPAASAVHQTWTIACNAVGWHEISGEMYWGGSGIWAPSGLKLIQGSNIQEELLIVHNIEIHGQRTIEKDDFDYAFDFKQVYRPMKGTATHSRMPERLGSNSAPQQA
jgi:predicted amidohydrolase